MNGAEDGFFIPTGDSGVPNVLLEMVLPTVISGAIEGSNVDQLANILELNNITKISEQNSL